MPFWNHSFSFKKALSLKSPGNSKGNRSLETKASALSTALTTKEPQREACKWLNQDLRTEYSIIKELGAGQFGTTYLVVNRGNGEKYACKSINKHQKNFNRDDVEREVKILHSLGDNPNIVDLREVWEDNHSIHLIMELCEGGELFDMIIERGHLSEKDAAVVARVLLEVIQHCHKHGVLHRDLKPENFILKKKLSRTDELTSSDLRAIDFGLSVFLKPGQKLKQLAGSSYYMAPEVLRGHYGYEADLWSAGVIMYILLSGLPPFWGSNEKAIFRRILNEPLDLQTAPWPDVSDEAKGIVSKLLNRNIHERMTVAQAMVHPWVREYLRLPSRPLSTVVFNRLKRFTQMTKMTKIMLNVVAKYCPDESISQLREMFQSLDRDGKGVVSVVQLQEAVAQLGVDIGEKQLQDLLAQLDVTDSGEIEYEEFLAGAINKKQLVQDQTMNNIFAQLDRDCDGIIGADELHDVMVECNINIEMEQLKELLKDEGMMSEKGGITTDMFKKLMFNLAKADLIPGRLEGFLQDANQYVKHNQFKQLALLVIASTIPPNEVQELNELFTSIDEEGTGEITYEQLKRSLDLAGCELAKEEVDDLISGLDVTGNGTISYNEFLAGCLEKQNLITEAKIKVAFDFFDADKSGSITLEEMRKALIELEMDPKEAETLVKLADANNNSEIDYQEFKNLMINTAGPNLLNRMSSIASMASSFSNGNPLIRTSMNLMRSSMGAPALERGSFSVSRMSIDLSRASMGPSSMGTPVQEMMWEVEKEWRKSSFTEGLQRPSMGGKPRPPKPTPGLGRPSTKFVPHDVPTVIEQD